MSVECTQAPSEGGQMLAGYHGMASRSARVGSMTLLCTVLYTIGLGGWFASTLLFQVLLLVCACAFSSAVFSYAMAKGYSNAVAGLLSLLAALGGWGC